MVDPGTAEDDLASGSRFRSAVAWAYMLDGGRQAVLLVSTLVMAAILGPETFGTFALANLSLLFAQMILRNGMSAAVIQRKELDQRGESTAFWILLVTSIVLMFVLLALAPLWSSINHDPEDLTAVNRALAVLLPLSVFNVMQSSVKRRQLDYRSLVAPTLIGVIAGVAVALVLALNDAGIWALVGQQLTSMIVVTIGLWMVADWRPTMEFDLSVGRDLLTFTGGALLSSIGEFVRNRTDTIIIGIVLGPLAVGIYRFAARFAEMVLEFSVRALQGAMLPGLARLQHDLGRLRNRVVETYRLAVLLTAVPIAGVFVVTDVLVSLVGEDEWGPASDAMRILTLVSLAQALSFMTAPILQSIGRPYAFAGIVWVQAGIAVAMFSGAAIVADDRSLATQVTIMAAARALSILVATCGEIVLVSWLSGIALRRILSAIAWPVVCVVATGVGAWLVASALDAHQLVELLAQLVVVAFAAAALFLFDRSIRSLALDGLQRIRPAPSEAEPDNG